MHAIAFSWTACWMTVLAVLASAATAALEGTLTSRRVTMGFCQHGGMWSDLITMPAVMGMVVPYLTRNFFVLGPVTSASALLTIGAHRQWLAWFRTSNITCHMFPSHRGGSLWRTLSFAGWMHILVMIPLLAVVMLYVGTQLPPTATLVTSALLTIHLWVSTILPGWYCTGILFSPRNLLPPGVLTFALWILTAVKIHFW